MVVTILIIVSHTELMLTVCQNSAHIRAKPCYNHCIESVPVHCNARQHGSHRLRKNVVLTEQSLIINPGTGNSCSANIAKLCHALKASWKLFISACAPAPQLYDVKNVVMAHA